MAKTESHDPLAAGSWDEVFGQDQLIYELRAYIHSAKEREESLPHILLEAGPGQGKTTVAGLIAAEMGTSLVKMNTNMAWPRMASIIRMANDGDIIFMDEIHGLAKNKLAVNNLLAVLETGITLAGNELPRITMIGATTDPDDLPEALLQRFPVRPAYAPQSLESMTLIVQSMARKLGVTLGSQLVKNLALASSGEPRFAGTLVRNCRVLQDNGESLTTDRVLAFTGVTKDGLTRRHLAYLEALWRNPKDGGEVALYRMGFTQLCVVLGMPKKTVERLERSLITEGYIELLPSGRQLTPKAVSMLRNN